MNARSNFRLVEGPLGPDALERPTREEVLAVWRAALVQPVPDYAVTALRRLFPRGC